MVSNPFDRIATSLRDIVPKKKMSFLPQKWEKVGNVAVIKLPKELEKYKTHIAECYANYLQCKTVLNDVGGISGLYREPIVEILFGDKNTETIHKENGIRFRLDLQKIMFSSGNMDERKRMATIADNNEIVVDLFAGIGYFSIPMAVKSKPKRIVACEINPLSYDYLCQNTVLNDVTSIIEPLLGDCRKTAPKNMANRVIMGHIRKTHSYLSTALECLKNQTGIIHYHDTFPEKKIPQQPMKQIKEIAHTYEKKVILLSHTCIKSYAPGISHAVVDVKIGD